MGKTKGVDLVDDVEGRACETDRLDEIVKGRKVRVADFFRCKVDEGDLISVGKIANELLAARKQLFVSWS